jgi:hypothetical protein
VILVCKTDVEKFQILEMMESLRRLVWKAESLSGSTGALSTTNNANLTSKVSSGVSSQNYSPEAHQPQPDQNISDYYDDRENPQIYGELISPNGPDTTVIGEFGEDETETIFYMFPVKQNTPLGEWIMGKFKIIYILERLTDY